MVGPGAPSGPSTCHLAASIGPRSAPRQGPLPGRETSGIRPRGTSDNRYLCSLERIRPMRGRVVRVVRRSDFPSRFGRMTRTAGGSASRPPPARHGPSLAKGTMSGGESSTRGLARPSRPAIGIEPPALATAWRGRIAAGMVPGHRTGAVSGAAVGLSLSDRRPPVLTATSP
jgi:hypothetical protein